MNVFSAGYDIFPVSTRFGDLVKGGEYKSDLPVIKRFAAMLGELVGGRVGLANGSVGVLKTACTIATRYALYRQQFGPPNKAEIVIMDYQSHQHKCVLETEERERERRGGNRGAEEGDGRERNSENCADDWKLIIICDTVY